MRIRIIKDHNYYSLGEHEVTADRGNYLISIGAAEKVEHYHKPEKVEIVPEKEKIEIQPGNVPTTRGRKKK